MIAAADYRSRFLAGETLIGTFVKTPSPHVVEILGTVGFDFIVIDAEHAPFSRRSIDMALLAARAAGVAAIVRTADRGAAQLLAALDDRAAGVLVPHIDSAEAARRLVSTCRYSGQRGYSNSPRAGGYGATAMWDHAYRSSSVFGRSGEGRTAGVRRDSFGSYGRRTCASPKCFSLQTHLTD